MGDSLGQPGGVWRTQSLACRVNGSPKSSGTGTTVLKRPGGICPGAQLCVGMQLLDSHPPKISLKSQGWGNRTFTNAIK